MEDSNLTMNKSDRKMGFFSIKTDWDDKRSLQSPQNSDSKKNNVNLLSCHPIQRNQNHLPSNGPVNTFQKNKIQYQPVIEDGIVRIKLKFPKIPMINRQFMSRNNSQRINEGENQSPQRVVPTIQIAPSQPVTIIHEPLVSETINETKSEPSITEQDDMSENEYAKETNLTPSLADLKQRALTLKNACSTTIQDSSIKHSQSMAALTPKFFQNTQENSIVVSESSLSLINEIELEKHYSKSFNKGKKNSVAVAKKTRKTDKHDKTCVIKLNFPSLFIEFCDKESFPSESLTERSELSRTYQPSSIGIENQI